MWLCRCARKQKLYPVVSGEQLSFKCHMVFLDITGKPHGWKRDSRNCRPKRLLPTQAAPADPSTPAGPAEPSVGNRRSVTHCPQCPQGHTPSHHALSANFLDYTTRVHCSHDAPGSGQRYKFKHDSQLDL